MVNTEKKHFIYGFILKIVIALLLFLIVLLTAGCGTVDMNVHTRVKPSGNIIQEITIATTGMMTTLIDSEFSGDLEGQGWKTERTTSGETTTFVATREFTKNEFLTVPGILEQDQSDNFTFYIDNKIIVKDYHLELMIPEDTSIDTEMSDSELTGDDDEIISDEMLDSMFKLSWTVTLPGRITDTNADMVSGNSATWNFPYSSTGSERYITVHSRYINWLVIGIIAGCVVLAVLLFLLLRKPGRRTGYYTPQQPPQYQSKMNQSTSSCFTCGYPNAMGRKFCVNCGQSLIRAGAQRTGSFQNQYNCPYCGYLNPAHSRFCSNCGQSLTGTGTAQSMGREQLYTCPVCRASLYYGTNPCPYCNTRMNWS